MSTLAAVAQTLVSDVANVIRIDALRSTPLIVDGSTNAKPALERTLRPWPGFIEWSPVELLPRHPRRNGDHVAFPQVVWCRGRSARKVW